MISHRQEDGFCLYVSSGGTKTKIFFPKNKTFSVFLEDLKSEFKLTNGSIELHEHGTNAEIKYSS